MPDLHIIEGEYSESNNYSPLTGKSAFIFETVVRH